MYRGMRFDENDIVKCRVPINLTYVNDCEIKAAFCLEKTFRYFTCVALEFRGSVEEQKYTVVTSGCDVSNDSVD